MCVLYPVSFLNSLISSSRFNVESFRFSTLTVFSSVNRLFHFFLSTLECLSFSCLILLTGTPSTVLSQSGWSRHPCIVLDFRRKYLFFKIKYDTSCSFSIDDLTRLRILISIPSFLRVFFKSEWILDYFFQMLFLHFFEIIRFSFSFLVF